MFAAIPATVVAAASFDDAIAITGYTLFINLAVRSGGSTVWDVMHGPLSIVFGVLAGGLAGIFCSATNLWNNNIKRTIVMFLTGVPTWSFPSSVSSAGAMCTCPQSVFAALTPDVTSSAALLPAPYFCGFPGVKTWFMSRRMHALNTHTFCFI